MTSFSRLQASTQRKQPMHLVASTPNAQRCFVQSYPGMAGGGTVDGAVAAWACVAATLPAAAAPAQATAPPRRRRNPRRASALLSRVSVMVKLSSGGCCVDRLGLHSERAFEK